MAGNRFDLLRSAVLATVLTVSVTVPFAPLTVAALNEHVGGTEVAGVIAQLRLTDELKLPTGAAAIWDVEELPGMIVDGDSGVDVRVKGALPDPAPTVKLAPVE